VTGPADEVVIERLRIACRSTANDGGEALRVRLRLESIARRHLPRALERSVPWAAVGAVSAVQVVLDVDPRDYDDVTLALLWADRIRQRLLAGSGPSVSRDTAASGWAPVVGVDAQRPLSELLRGDDPETVALRALAGDEGALASLLAACSRPGDRAAVLDALHRTLRPFVVGLLEEREAAAGRGGGPRAQTDPRSARSPESAAVLDRSEAHEPDRQTPSPPALRGWRDAVAAADRALSPELARTLASAKHVTSVGGLVLLWPWLGTFLEQATADHADLDEVGVRRLAIARLVPDLEGADRDDLVRFLAGADLQEPAATLDRLRLGAEVDDAADGVLRAFAAVLPGFERSSLDYLRRELVRRPGLLELDADPGRLVLPPMPLDPVLALLPYPLGIVRLPWTPALAISLGGRP
jgi:Contractile injection system tape measure protein